MDDTKSKQLYPSDLTDEQWAILEPLIPVNTGQGQPTKVSLRAVINAIFYRTRSGCQWRYLPNDFPPMGTVYYYFRKWAKDATWSAINTALRQKDRVTRERSPEPSGAIFDSQSVKTN